MVRQLSKMTSFVFILFLATWKWSPWLYYIYEVLAGRVAAQPSNTYVVFIIVLTGRMWVMW